jgi:serine/threonine-protein phosphatase 2A regulatory subunit A
MTETSSINPKSIISDLQNSESKIKANAIKNIPILIEAIGHDRFRKEFLPYLINCLDVEEDDCLLELAKDIGIFLEGIGGKNYIHDLYPLLETILHTDDIAIRREINLSIEVILQNNSENEFKNDIMKLIIELSNSEEIGFKRNSCSLIGTCYGSLNEKERKEMMKILKTFLNHGNQMVKIELVMCMKKISCYMERNNFQNFLKNY